MKIGIDIDDVLAEFITPLLEYTNSLYNINLRVEEINSYGLRKFWKCSKEEELNRLEKFYKTNKFNNNIKPLKGAQEGVKKLKENGDELYLISSRPNKLHENTAKWIEKHYWNKFSGLYLTNQSSLNGISNKKSEVCKCLDIEIMIEDSIENAIDCASEVEKILLLDYTWNQENDLPKNIKRVYSWDDITEEILNKKIK